MGLEPARAEPADEIEAKRRSPAYAASPASCRYCPCAHPEGQFIMQSDAPKAGFIQLEPRPPKAPFMTETANNEAIAG